MKLNVLLLILLESSVAIPPRWEGSSLPLCFAAIGTGYFITLYVDPSDNPTSILLPLSKQASRSAQLMNSLNEYNISAGQTVA